MAFAQPQGGPKGGHGKQDFEKIRAEKVAFITSEVGLTVEEAQAFWPIYNEIEQQQKELMMAERKAYAELNKALAEGKGNDKALLKAYINAKEANKNLQLAAADRYLKVLSVEKVAKFYTCEEKFLRQQIGRLRGGHGNGPKGSFDGGRKGPGAPGGKGFQKGQGPRDGKDFPKGQDAQEKQGK
jgi:Spy/CpxP family protein refolding chaperone